MVDHCRDRRFAALASPAAGRHNDRCPDAGPQSEASTTRDPPTDPRHVSASWCATG